MSYVAPEMKSRFETLSIDLKNEILKETSAFVRLAI